MNDPERNRGEVAQRAGFRNVYIRLTDCTEDLFISYVSRIRPSSIVYLMRKEKRSDLIESFNFLSELVMIIETVCRKYKSRE